MEQAGKFNEVDNFLAEDTYLFYCDVQTCSIQNHQIFSLLNAADCERYVKFRTSLRKYQFGLARCLVKQVLFQYFNIPLAHQYQIINYCEWVVADTKDKFYISISHSKNLVVVAISLKKQSLGVDVEYQKDRDFQELINGFASVNEKIIFNRNVDKKQIFYQLWTAKEAYIKAFQMTLSELTRIDLSASFGITDNNLKWHLSQRTIENNEYFVSLISDVAATNNIQKIFIK